MTALNTKVLGQFEWGSSSGLDSSRMLWLTVTLPPHDVYYSTKASLNNYCITCLHFSGEKPDPADYFKSSSCPKITSSLAHRENMTVGSTTITMDTTSPSDNQRRNIDSVASENLDPSQNVTPQNVSLLIAPSVTSSRSGSLEMSCGSFANQPSSVSIVGEKRIRQRVGRNLLGAAQSASPLTPRYDFFRGQEMLPLL